MKIAGEMTEAAPKVIVDAVRFWTPTSSKSVDFTEVKDYIISLKSRGFNLRMVTFDRWNSHDMMQQLKAYGINTEILSVAKKHYDDMALIITEERVNGPAIKLLIDELLQLRIMRDKVDHPRKGSKDLADAVCGSIYNSISKTRKGDREINVHTYSTLVRDENDRQRQQESNNNIIRSPEAMPAEMRQFLDSLNII
jgi:hypothetical protein